MLNRALPFIVFFLFNICWGQEYVDLLKIDYLQSPQNQFENSNTTTSLSEFTLGATLPLTINEKHTFLTGVNYELISTQLDVNSGTTNISNLIAKIGVNSKYSDTFSATYMLLPNIASDFKQIKSRDLQLGGLALFKFSKSPNMNYRLGLYAANELFGTFVVPLFGGYYLSPNNKFETTVLLPLNGDFNYRLNKSSKLGCYFKGQIKSYNINTPIAQENERYLEKSTRELYLYYNYETAQGINFKLGVGRSISRTYSVYNETVDLGLPLVFIGDNRTVLNSLFEDNWVFKLSVYYRYKLKAEVN